MWYTQRKIMFMLMHRYYKGSALVFSLVVLSFLLMSAVSLATISAIARKSSLSSKSSNIAFQSADSILERMLQKIYTTPGDPDPYPTISNLATSLSSSCSGSTISGSTTDGTYTAKFYDINDTVVTCNDTNWHDAVRKVKFQSLYGTNNRAIEINITPTCHQVEYGGVTYPASTFVTGIVPHCWMTEDLNYDTASGDLWNPEDVTVVTNPVTGGSGHAFPGQRLYTWDTAMKGDSATAVTPRKQGICPPNWFIPFPSDFDDLGNSTDKPIPPALPQSQKNNLKSTLWSAWYPYTFNATDPNLNKDKSLFKAFPAGSADASGTMVADTRGKYAYYWTSDAGVNATVATLQYNNSGLSSSTIDKSTYRSVRCIKY